MDWTNYDGWEEVGGRPHDGRQRTRAAVLMMVLVVAGLVLACVEAGVLARYAIGVPVVSDPTLAEMLG